jgi:hypothetical protein
MNNSQRSPAKARSVPPRLSTKEGETLARKGNVQRLNGSGLCKNFSFFLHWLKI